MLIRVLPIFEFKYRYDISIFRFLSDDISISRTFPFRTFSWHAPLHQPPKNGPFSFLEPAPQATTTQNYRRLQATSIVVIMASLICIVSSLFYRINIVFCPIFDFKIDTIYRIAIYRYFYDTIYIGQNPDRDIVIALGVPVEPRALGPSFPPHSPLVAV